MHRKADIKLGYSCNNECLHCVISDYRDRVLKSGLPEDIPEEDYRRELKDSRTRADMIVFTGGEPTIRPEILDLVAYARDLGYRIFMQTNGRRLANLDFAQALCAVAPIEFTIALHGPDAGVHDKITQRDGSFYETIQGIRNVIEIRKNASSLSGKIVISKINAPYLVQTVRLMIWLGFVSVNLTFPHACGNARKYFFDVVPRYSEIKYQVINSIETCIQAGVSVSTEAIPFCFLPDQEFAPIELRMAEEEYSELKQYGSDNKIIDWTRVRTKIKSKFPQCKQCRFDAVCEGPWIEYPQNYGQDEFIPVPGEPVTTPKQIINRSYLPEKMTSLSFCFTPQFQVQQETISTQASI